MKQVIEHSLGRESVKNMSSSKKPKKDEQAKQQSKKETDCREEDRVRPLILLADDDMEIRFLVKSALSALDCDFIEAADGEETLESILTESPDLVVLDVMMPVLSGWEICQYVKSKPGYQHIRILMLTAIGQEVNQLTAPLYGADEYLDKPFDVLDILKKAQGLLLPKP
jgi:CheY-like chemotaxis protein